MKSTLEKTINNPATQKMLSEQRLAQFAAGAILPAALLCKERSERACRKAGQGYDEQNVTAGEIAAKAMQIAVALEQEFAAMPPTVTAPAKRATKSRKTTKK